MTRAARVIEFIERFCVTPEGAHVGQPLVLGAQLVPLVGQRRQAVGGRFVALSPAIRARIGEILSFDEARPAFRLVRIERPRPARPKARPPRAGRKSPRAT